MWFQKELFWDSTLDKAPRYLESLKALKGAGFLDRTSCWIGLCNISKFAPTRKQQYEIAGVCKLLRIFWLLAGSRQRLCSKKRNFDHCPFISHPFYLWSWAGLRSKFVSNFITITPPKIATWTSKKSLKSCGWIRFSLYTYKF